MSFKKCENELLQSQYRIWYTFCSEVIWCHHDAPKSLFHKSRWLNPDPNAMSIYQNFTNNDKKMEWVPPCCLFLILRNILLLLLSFMTFVRKDLIKLSRSTIFSECETSFIQVPGEDMSTNPATVLVNLLVGVGGIPRINPKPPTRITIFYLFRWIMKFWKKNTLVKKWKGPKNVIWIAHLISIVSQQLHLIE